MPSGSKTPYVPPPSLGQELGVLFGFAAAMVLAIAAYYVVWGVVNKRSLAREAERVRALRAAGYMPAEEKGGEEELVR